MGVSMESKHHSADFTCGGFKRLRTKVAELTAPDIFRHYIKLDYAFYLYGKERENFFEEYNKKIEELDDKYQGENRIFWISYICLIVEANWMQPTADPFGKLFRIITMTSATVIQDYRTVRSSRILRI